MLVRSAATGSALRKDSEDGQPVVGEASNSRWLIATEAALKVLAEPAEGLHGNQPAGGSGFSDFVVFENPCVPVRDKNSVDACG